MKPQSQPHDSAIISMDDVEELYVEDDAGFNPDKRKSESTSQEENRGDFYSSIRDNVSSVMWQESTRKAKSAFSSYANVDLLRPYFDVQPMEVLNRLFLAFVPLRVSNNAHKVHSELYGPVMICFTLVAVLLFEMKSSDHRVQEGTLMGSAIVTVFGYWLGVSSLLWLVTYVCKTHLKPVEVSTLLGYSLVSHAVVLFLTTIFHPSHSHAFFYFLWLILGGLTTLKLVITFTTRTPGHTERVIVAALISILHMLFLVYLHFAYHKIVKDLSDVLNQGQRNPAVGGGDPLLARSGRSQSAGLLSLRPQLGLTVLPTKLHAF